MFYILYQVTNNLNGKIYVGVHKTKKLDDGYMGSGKIICSAITKHGIANFSKVILEQFDTSDAMYAREKEVVTDEFLARDDTYNLRRGGSGGFDYINKTRDQDKNIQHIRSQSKKGTAALVSKLSTNPEFATTWKRHKSIAIKCRIDAGLVIGFIDPLLQQRASVLAQGIEAKEKRARTRKEKKFQQGTNNSQYGTTWIWHELIGNKKILRDLLPEYIEQGWYKKYVPGYRICLASNKEYS